MKDVILEYENGTFIPATVICCFKINTNDKRYTFYSLGEKEGDLEKVYVGEQLKIKNELFIGPILKEDFEEFQKLLQAMVHLNIANDARYETRLFTLEGKKIRVQSLSAIKLKKEVMEKYFEPIGESIEEEPEEIVIKKKKPVFFIKLIVILVILFLTVFFGTPFVVNIITERSKKSAFQDQAINVVQAMEYRVVSKIVLNPDYYEDVDLSKDSLGLVFPNTIKGHVISLGEGKTALEMTDGTFCARKEVTDDTPIVTKLGKETCDGETLSKKYQPKENPKREDTIIEQEESEDSSNKKETDSIESDEEFEELLNGL